MMTTWILLAATLGAGETSGTIVGTAQNGTRHDSVLASVEIVLRASRGGSWVVVAETTSDEQGNFSFTGLDTSPQMVYQAGANWQGIHYPGPRVQFRRASGPAEARVTLTAYDAIESPSPLICRRYQIQVRPQVGFCEVTETLDIDNPTLTTYVGESSEDHPTVTLKWDLPTGVEKVTFEKEFHGRNFHFTPRGLATQLPWKPGSQEIRFIYRIPVLESRASLARTLSLPAEHVAIDIAPEEASVQRGDVVLCSLPRVSDTTTSTNGSSEPTLVRFASDERMAAGKSIEIRWNVARLPWEVWARWGAVGLVAVALGGIVFFARRPPSTKAPVPSPNAASDSASSVPRPSRRFLNLHRRRKSEARRDRVA